MGLPIHSRSPSAGVAWHAGGTVWGKRSLRDSLRATPWLDGRGQGFLLGPQARLHPLVDRSIGQTSSLSLLSQAVVPNVPESTLRPVLCAFLRRDPSNIARLVALAQVDPINPQSRRRFAHVSVERIVVAPAVANLKPLGSVVGECRVSGVRAASPHRSPLAIGSSNAAAYRPWLSREFRHERT